MKTFTLPTRDDFVLSATEFMPAREARGTVVFAGATGVPQGYYRALAEHLRDSGFRAVTFDYRGLGRSKPQSLRGFKADYFDWAERDLAAVLDHAAGAGQVFLVCHSFGGHALGLLPNHEKVRAVFSFGVGAGNVRYMPFSEWPRVFVLWNLLGPLLTRAFGYLPSKHLGMGENLPLGVYRHWKHWCSLPRFWFDDARYAFAERFAAVRAPITALSAEDDRWAPRVSVDLFNSFYTGSLLERVHLRASDHGLKRITHMGFFRREHFSLWPLLTAWLERSGARAAE